MLLSFTQGLKKKKSSYLVTVRGDHEGPGENTVQLQGSGQTGCMKALVVGAGSKEKDGEVV